MNALRFNILFVSLLLFNLPFQAQSLHKRFNFVSEESEVISASTQDRAIDANNFISQVNMVTTLKYKENNKQSVSLYRFRLEDSANKRNFIHRLIQSHFKLSFRLKGNFNLLISYT